LFSSKFPEVDFSRAWYHIDQVNNTNPEIRGDKQKLQRMNVELAFIRATRSDSTMGLKSALQRRELFEFVLRMASQWVQRLWSEKEKLSDHL